MDYRKNGFGEEYRPKLSSSVAITLRSFDQEAELQI